MRKQTVNTQIFINESSLQGQFQSIAEFEKAVRELINLLMLINQQENFIHKLYKTEFFVAYNAIKNSPFTASLNTLKDKSLKRAFTNIIFNKLNPINWHSERLHQLQDNYILVETLENVTNTSIAEVAERKLQDSEKVYLLINFSNSSFTTHHQIYCLCQIITVSKNQQSLIELDCLAHKTAFAQWVQDKLDQRNFLERNPGRFSKTNYVVQGQTVYAENDTGYSWYLDNLHKNHFEVFNQQGVHLGETNLFGMLDETKKDNSKSFKR